MGLFRLLLRLFAPPRRKRARYTYAPPQRVEPKQTAIPATVQVTRRTITQAVSVEGATLTGQCWVIDGDTIDIGGKRIRLAGIDAPELDHPYGRNAKSVLIGLCRGQMVRAEFDGAFSYERSMATCYLPDGRDLSAEMVKAGVAIDWPRYSGGKYRNFEAEGIRKKLWRCDARQKGRMPPLAKGQD